MRWPVIEDRYSFVPSRRTDEIQERYFEIVSKLNNRRHGLVAEGANSHDTVTYSGSVERKRRNMGIQKDIESTKQDIRAVERSLEELKTGVRVRCRVWVYWEYDCVLGCI